MKQLILSIACATFSLFVQAQNKTDDKQRKQGPWVEQVESIRGEPGYSWEGVYKNSRKEGVWKKFTIAGDLMAEETFRNGSLDGLCKYYYPDGKLSAAGQMLAMDIEGQKDTIMVIDPVTQEEKLTEVVRKGHSVRHGEWRVYDEEGNMMKEVYERGELVESAAGGRSKSTANPLPHQQERVPKKKKG